MNAIRLVAYEDRPGLFVFVAVPNARGRYLRTDKSVVLVGCPFCKSVRGEPCKANGGTDDGYGGTTHAVRRQLAKERGDKDTADDYLDRRLPDPEPAVVVDVPVRRKPQAGDIKLLAEPRPMP